MIFLKEEIIYFLSDCDCLVRELMVVIKEMEEKIKEILWLKKDFDVVDKEKVVMEV